MKITNADVATISDNFNGVIMPRRQLKLDTKTWAWVKAQAKSLDPARKGKPLSSNGHEIGPIKQSTAAFFMFMTILLILSIMYMMYRVYYLKKYLSKSWVRQYGRSTLMDDISTEINDKQ